YVAATRAKKFLHLFGHVTTTRASEETKIRLPRAGSLLNRLWPVVEKDFNKALSEGLCRIEERNFTNNQEKKYNQSIARITSNWQLPVAPQSVVWQSNDAVTNTQEQIEFFCASEIARHIGSIVHRTLQQMAEDKLYEWNDSRIHAMRRMFKLGLLNNGLSADHKTLERAVDRIVVALTNTLADERGQWLLSEKKE